MQHEEKIEAIRKACIAANPSIQSKYHESTGNNLRCKNCGEPDTYENRGTCKNGSARPIGLCDILLAMEIDEDDGSDEQLQDKASTVAYMWNKYSDDFTLQEPYVVDFVYSLLTTKN